MSSMFKAIFRSGGDGSKESSSIIGALKKIDRDGDGQITENGWLLLFLYCSIRPTFCFNEFSHIRFGTLLPWSPSWISSWRPGQGIVCQDWYKRQRKIRHVSFNSSFFSSFNSKSIVLYFFISNTGRKHLLL